MNAHKALSTCPYLCALIWGLLCFPGRAQDVHDIVRRAFELNQKTEDASRDYTYIQRQHTRMLDGNGKVKRESCKTEDITILEGSSYRRLIARDDKPLSPAEQQQEDERLRYADEERRKEPPAQRAKRLAEAKKRHDERTAPFREVVDAFDFKLSGEETVNGAPAWIVDATPRQGFKPKSSAASMLPKFKGRLWISKADYGLVRIDAETLGTISYGTILFRLAKGSRIHIDLEKVNDLWLRKHIAIQLSGRVMLVSGIHAEIEFDYRDYRKFQADSRVIATGEKR